MTFRPAADLIGLKWRTAAGAPPDRRLLTMRTPQRWRPSRFEQTTHGWRGSSDPRRVAPGSRHTADLQARAYAPAMREYARGRLLDLGCGNVPLYEMYRPWISSAVCADWPKSYHDRAHVDVACDVNRPLPFKDGAFDTVVMSDVLEHLFDYETVWAEIARVLRRGGRVIVGVPFMYWLHEEPYDYFRPTEFALRRCCERHGLTIRSLDPYGGALDVLFDVTAKHVAVSTLLARAFYWFGRVALPLGRPVFARSERKFPLGYLLVAER
jgi:SAM-dependent methyltransferase